MQRSPRPHILNKLNPRLYLHKPILISNHIVCPRVAGETQKISVPGSLVYCHSLFAVCILLLGDEE